jgi:ribosomal protein S14
MIPRSCAYSSASAIGIAMGNGSSNGIGPLLDPIRERDTFNQLHHQGTNAIRFFEAIDRRNVRMIQRCEELGLALEARHAFGVARKCFRLIGSEVKWSSKK